MLTSLKSHFTRPTIPSVLLVLSNSSTTIHILHLLPETGGSTIERLSLTYPSTTTTFRHRGAREQAREQIGTVTLYVGDGETPWVFLNDVKSRIRKLLQQQNDSKSSSQLQTTDSLEEVVTQLVKDVLQPAALDAIHAMRGRDRSMNATRMYSVYVVYILRSDARRSLIEFTSFP
ncbi:hypothetical protein AbraIFM66951_008195 [Aspergillus brasiliensis]|uniref:Uncharacterized protein n=1 Tax=Aspergillus brasiliensis TaxID=319629 RepID=A0A9W5YMD3_9EURO|nr:hypothetical protein AbraCBS73388_005262 [Aspergillus brasiliensis]GKZ45542.1 hypothetical protein AbraIFM66951_008195 [Aspergillus brasiliensis]